MSILPDHEILAYCRHDAMVRPFNHEQVEPASYDVRLGNKFRVFQRDAQPYVDLANPWDITKEVVVLKREDYFLLHPGEFVLGMTDEKVKIPDNIVCRIEGKSSTGRLGLIVHATAGYIDPGFEGRITLEMTSFHPLPMMLRPGELIAQLSFQYLNTPCVKPYEGRYQGDDTVKQYKGVVTHKKGVTT